MKREPQNALDAVRDYFETQRFSETNHVGLGDIRLTIGQQEEVLEIIACYTEEKFTGI